MSYNDLRKGRWNAPGQEYLVTTVTAGRRARFVDIASARPVIEMLSRTHDDKTGLWLAWVLMPDHFHGLLSLGEQASVSEVMRRFKGRSGHAWNNVMGGKASLWEVGFHDHALRFDEDRRTVARYIIGNPVRAGIVKKVGNYPFWDTVWLDPLSD